MSADDSPLQPRRQNAADRCPLKIVVLLNSGSRVHSGAKSAPCGTLGQVQTAIPHRSNSATCGFVEPSPKRPFRQSIFFIVLVAFVLRLAVILVGHTYRINPLRDHFQFGWEMGRIARSVIHGQGFSSPTVLNTGPAAWAPPVYL